MIRYLLSQTNHSQLIARALFPASFSLLPTVCVFLLFSCYRMSRSESVEWIQQLEEPSSVPSRFGRINC
ncbi:hypothetical protein GYMLUDRAFT_674951 [Collybiopsis luxurians FD-317 M1]|uniref:Uncharacterized protein n=1 Tax=Collybiopsis luxurians FD-317 M1 TaxID=944289 RepID=A0A0D0CL47_9AGAR|nr:hypothetical protein GYMLUDRAFT_674951 [Collybiopsis luxurians FD-317 M1]